MAQNDTHDLLAKVDRLTQRIKEAEGRIKALQEASATLQSKAARQRNAMAKLTTRNENARSHIARLHKILWDALHGCPNWRDDAAREVDKAAGEKGRAGA